MMKRAGGAFICDPDEPDLAFGKARPNVGAIPPCQLQAMWWCSSRAGRRAACSICALN